MLRHDTSSRLGRIVRWAKRNCGSIYLHYVAEADQWYIALNAIGLNVEFNSPDVNDVIREADVSIGELD